MRETLAHNVRYRLLPSEAKRILIECNGWNRDFHVMSSSEVDQLLEFAKRAGYRKPKSANGSRARYYHAYLTRCATSLTNLGREAVAGKNATVIMSRDGQRVQVSSW